MENYNDILTHLLNHSENEVVEFKAAKNNYDVDDLGKYFSALSNEANLREHDFAWIVFGVDNKTHIVTGTNFKEGEQALNRLKQDMSQHTTDNLIFREIAPLFIEGKLSPGAEILKNERGNVFHGNSLRSFILQLCENPDNIYAVIKLHVVKSFQPIRAFQGDDKLPAGRQVEEFMTDIPKV